MKSIVLALIITCSFLSTYANTQPTWGKTGHRVVGAIADTYLKNSTKRKIKKLLSHESLALVATFPDEIKYDKRYDQFKTWHYLNMGLDETYEGSEKNPKGDLVTGINYCKQVLSDDNATLDDRAFYLKMLIHLIGDLHQPMHLGLIEDRGGNDFDVQWFYKDSNMHKVWDSQMVDGFDMSYSELADNSPYLTDDQVKAIEKGTVLDWIAETHLLTKDVYASAEKDENLRNAYAFKYLIIARKQMQKAGIRLAEVLNEIL